MDFFRGNPTLTPLKGEGSTGFGVYRGEEEVDPRRERRKGFDNYSTGMSGGAMFGTRDGLIPPRKTK